LGFALKFFAPLSYKRGRKELRAARNPVSRTDDGRGVFMKNYNILTAFLNEKVSRIVENMLAVENIYLSYSCKSASELKKNINYCQSGVIICGYKLKDSTIVQFIDDIPEGFGVILIGNKSQAELCQSDRVFKLIVPLKKEDLICSVYMLLNMREDYNAHNVSFRTSREEKVIRAAKEILIDRYNLTEEQAHRYLQKKSMDTGRKIIDVARIILN